jgi:hypothetical protein
VDDTDGFTFRLENNDVGLVPAAPVAAADLRVAVKGGSRRDLLEPSA